MGHKLSQTVHFLSNLSMVSELFSLASGFAVKPKKKVSLEYQNVLFS